MNLLNKLRPLVSSSGNSRALRCSNFCINFDLKALAKISSPSATSSAIKSVNSSITQVSSKSQSTRPSTTRTFLRIVNYLSSFVMNNVIGIFSEAPDQIYEKLTKSENELLATRWYWWCKAWVDSSSSLVSMAWDGGMDFKNGLFLLDDENLRNRWTNFSKRSWVDMNVR